MGYCQKFIGIQIPTFKLRNGRAFLQHFEFLFNFHNASIGYVDNSFLTTINIIIGKRENLVIQFGKKKNGELHVCSISYGKLSSIPNEMYVVALHAVHFLPFRGYISIEGLIFIYVAYTKYTRVGPASTLRVQRQIILVLWWMYVRGQTM